MKIGNLPLEGEATVLNKWYIGIEILPYPPYRCYRGFAFKPYILIVCMKTTDFGTEYFQVNGTPGKQKGGYKSFTFPFGFCIERI